MYTADKSSELFNDSKSLMARALLSVASIAVISALPQIAFAQTAPDSAETSGQQVDEGDVVIVTGFRQSIADALDAKRNAKNIVDAIKAEDIGKSTDQNIAEALQRITGVSINRGESGEGTTIVARGAPAALNNITLNGVPLTNGGEGSAVDLSQFSSDVLSSIEVVKTPSASLDEGSLGASIILKGFSPLDSRKNRRVIEVQGRYNSFADENQTFSPGDFFSGDRKFSGSLSQKFLDDTLGVSIVAVDEKSTSRRDEYGVGQGYRPYDASRFGGGVINAETGEFITQFDYGDGQGERNIIAHMPQQIRLTNNEVETARQTLTGTVQYKPNDDLNMKLDVTYASVDRDRRTNEFSAISNTGNRDTANPDLQDHLVFDPNTFVLVRNIHTASGPRNNNREDVLQYADIRHKTEQDTLTISGLVEKTIGDFDFSLQAGHSKTDLTTPQRLFTRFRNARNRDTGVTLGYDCGSTPDICNLVISDDYISDPTTFSYNTANISDQVGSDEATSLYFDTEWNKDFGPFKSFEAGLKWSTRNKKYDDSSIGFNAAQTDNVLRDAGDTFADFAILGVIPSNFGETLGLDTSALGANFVGLNGERVLSRLAEEGFEPQTRRNLRTSLDITQDVWGGYVQGNFELLDGSIFGDIGVRAVQTELDSRGFSGFNYNQFAFDSESPTRDDDNVDFLGSPEAVIALLGQNTPFDSPDTATVATNKYTSILPSLNVNWLVKEDVMLRFAASQTIARPRIDSLKSGFSLTEDIFNASSRATIGAPGLTPFKSQNFDISFEWYFDSSSLFSVALFDKKLKDFAEEGSFNSYYRDLRSEYFNADGTVLSDDQINFVASFDSVFLPFSAGANQAGCMPNREQALVTPNGEGFCDEVLVTQSRNGTGGYVRGVEVAFQHNFDYLPSIMSHLGVLANYTYADSQADAETDELTNSFFPQTPLPETSEHTVNLTGFYEDDRVLMRLAYNYRTDYLINRSTRNNNAEWIEGFDTLDASGTFKINDMFGINFQAQNLLDTVTRQYVTTGAGDLPTEPFAFGGNTARTSRLLNTGRIYRVGVRMTF